MIPLSSLGARLSGPPVLTQTNKEILFIQSAITSMTEMERAARGGISNDMAKIAYILLCHKDPDAVIAQAERLTAVGDYVAIHFDGSAPQAEFSAIKDALKDTPNAVLVERRVRCGWGQWSLVKATLTTLATALDAFPHASHAYLLSGDCMPIKSARYIRAKLDATPKDFIESVDFFTSKWIKTGWDKERIIYRHWFNERRHPWLFYGMYEIQRRLGLKQKPPPDLQMMIGSQWWCLRRKSAERILAFSKKRRDVARFFAQTWIPDESYFQTLIRHLIPSTEIDSRSPTFLMFTDYGLPVHFHNDHYDLLVAQDYLFARKISPQATKLKERLGALYAAEQTAFQISDTGRSLHQFLTARGRVGRRFGARFWEAESRLGADCELLIVVCKKWDVAKRMMQQIAAEPSITGLDYIFDSEEAKLPDLGGVQTNLLKRHRHRRALVRMLFDYFGTQRLAFCMDPESLSLISDFGAASPQTKFLEIDCTYSDADLRDLAVQKGLASDHQSADLVPDLTPTLRSELAYESARLQSADLNALFHISQSKPAVQNADALAQFLGLDHGRALHILNRSDLFSGSEAEAATI